MTSLQRKLSTVEDQLAARPDVDDVIAKNRKLMSLVDKYKSELSETHREIHELKSRLMDTADVQVQDVALSQGEPRDAAVNFDTYEILQQVDDGTFMYGCTLNTATLLTRTHLAPKPAQNTLNHL